jgi:hypothetical protein
MCKKILAHMEDIEIKSVIEHALNLSEQHIQKIKNFLDQEKYPLPTGFTDEDVNLNVPRLYSDTFWLMYIQIMAAIGMPDYALALNTSSRSDVRSYFTQCNADALALFNKAQDLLLLKGLLVTPPPTPMIAKTELIKKPDLLINLFGKHTTLNGLEISHIFYNLQKIDVAIALEIGFLQVVGSKEIKELIDDNITPPKTWASEVTSSTIAPFSDKLMMSHIALLLKAAVLFHGAALSSCIRKDLAAGQKLKVYEQASLKALFSC